MESNSVAVQSFNFSFQVSFCNFNNKLSNREVRLSIHTILLTLCNTFNRHTQIINASQAGSPASSITHCPLSSNSAQKTKTEAFGITVWSKRWKWMIMWLQTKKEVKVAVLHQPSLYFMSQLPKSKHLEPQRLTISFTSEVSRKTAKMAKKYKIKKWNCYLENHFKVMQFYTCA